MIYGRSYEGRTRACAKCGHSTNVHMLCDSCEAHICENCASVFLDRHYCDQHCHQEDCYHIVAQYDGHIWTCTDCGAHLDGEGLPVRRAAGSQGRLPSQSKQKEG